MNEDKYDVIVIGSGPGGEGSSMMCAKAGKRVAVVEDNIDVGGNCTHKGTIPSKAIRHSISQVMEFQNNPFTRKMQDHGARASLPEMVQGAQAVIQQQVDVRNSFYVRNHCDVKRGRARFIDAHTIIVERAGSAPETLHADHFILAMGSRPFRPDNIDFTHPLIRDSDTILDIHDTPHTVTVYGAGVIGCEYASMLGSMGIKVNLINSQDRLLSFLDEEITDALTYLMRDQGVVIRQNEVYKKVEATNRHVILHLKSGKKIKSEMLLWANGRSGNTQNMGLDEIGVNPNSRGQLELNENYQTKLPHIYAVGDLAGYPGLASAAYDQGRFAATHLLTGECNEKLVSNIPTGIYTIPEISSIGLNEQQASEQGIPYEVGHASFKHLARSQMTGQGVGMLKIVFHTKTLEVLGIHCFGDRASETVHIGQAIMAQEGKANTIKYFMNTTFNYPTMAEAYRVAALSGINRLC